MSQRDLPHCGSRMEFSGKFVGNMPSTCLKMFTHLSEPHHTMEAWRDVRIWNATKGSRDRPVARPALFYSAEHASWLSLVAFWLDWPPKTMSNGPPLGPLCGEMGMHCAQTPHGNSRKTSTRWAKIWIVFGFLFISNVFHTYWSVGNNINCYHTYVFSS